MGEGGAVEWDGEGHENENPHDLLDYDTAGILWDVPSRCDLALKNNHPTTRWYTDYPSGCKLPGQLTSIYLIRVPVFEFSRRRKH
jgi:hypothetical protein